jgi:Ca2+-binding RTX toxin-like protein
MPTIDGDNFNNILIGSDDKDTIFGNGGNDQLFGLGNNDVLFGGTGVDTLEGGAGNDLLSGSDAFPPNPDNATDTLKGGPGNDRYFVIEDADLVVEKANEGIDTVQFGTFSYKLGDNVENLQFERSAHNGIGNELRNIMTVTKADDDSSKLMDGRGGNDLLISAEGDDQLFGGEGADNLIAHGGNDKLDGGNGDDRLDGGDGVDTLTGGAGRDFLRGGALGDVLTGGAGNDTFSYAGTSDESRGALSATRDTITDFTKGEDKFSFSIADANTQAPGDQDFTFIGNANFTAPGQIHAINVAQGTLVEANTDFDTGAEISILLDDKVTLSLNDFFL